MVHLEIAGFHAYFLVVTIVLGSGGEGGGGGEREMMTVLRIVSNVSVWFPGGTRRNPKYNFEK